MYGRNIGIAIVSAMAGLAGGPDMPMLWQLAAPKRASVIVPSGVGMGYFGQVSFKPPGNQRQRRKAMRQRRSGWGRKQMQRGRCR